VLNANRPQNNQRAPGSPSDIAGTMNPINATSLSQALDHVTQKIFGVTRDAPSQQSPTAGISSSQNETVSPATKTSTASLVSKAVSGTLDGVFARAKDWGRGKHTRKRQDQQAVTVRPHETESNGSHPGNASDGEGGSGSGSGSGELTYSESRSSFSSKDARRNFRQQNSQASSLSSWAGTHSVITGSIGGNTNSGHGSQPSSHPGTASSHGSGGGGGGGAVLSSRHSYISTQSSPRQPPNTHSLPNPRNSTSSVPSSSRSFTFASPPHSLQVKLHANFQQGSVASDSILSPTSVTSTSSSHQLVTPLSYAGSIFPPSLSSHGRPDYRRQALEPYPSKRPHLQRGDVNFNVTLEDHGNDGAVDVFESEGVFGHDKLAHSKGARALGSGHERGANDSVRSMSEPTVSAPRVIMRMPGVGSGGN
jgi:hypothetical protein